MKAIVDGKKVWSQFILGIIGISFLVSLLLPLVPAQVRAEEAAAPAVEKGKDVYYKTEAGFEDLVKSCYPLLRNIHQSRILALNGTDSFAGISGW